MSDLIRRSDAIKALYKYSFVSKDIIEREINAIPSADRPRGEVDAVKEYEHQVHNLDQGYITLGEFDKRIEPLRHLHYDRPQGEWIRTGRTNIYGGIEVQCSNCGDKVMVQHLEDEWYCRHCGADMGMKGADDETD